MQEGMTVNQMLNIKIFRFRNFFLLLSNFVCLFSVTLFSTPGATALHLAIESKDREDLVTLLIEHGADLNIVNEFDWTPLEVAIDKSIPFGFMTSNFFWTKKLYWNKLRIFLLNLINKLENDVALELLIKNGAKIPEKALIIAASRG